MKVACVILIFAVSTLASADNPSIFKDANLKAAVEAALGISDPNPSDMLGLNQLTANSKDITDLTGLGFAHNLLYLNLSTNHIADVNELAKLKTPNCLRYLFLSDNFIADISPLAELKDLKYLSLSGNNISDISGLADFNNLECLGLDDNRIHNISTLAKLVNLKSLSLINNQIHDISPLTNLEQMNSLYLTSNLLDTSAYCTHLAKIREKNIGIYISHDNNPNPLTGDCSTSSEELSQFIFHWLESPIDPNHEADLNYDDKTDIVDFGVFSGLWYRDVVYFPDPNLKSAVEAQLGINNPDPDDMTLLTSLKAPYNGITNLAGLQYAFNLRELHLNANQISNLSALSELTTLEILDLSDNQISDMSFLSNLMNLKTLALQSNQISEIVAITGLTSLETLDLSDNNIFNIPNITGLTALKTLDLSENQISSLSAIGDLSDLICLDVSSNKIGDISALEGLNNLNILYLSDNPLNTPAYCTATVPGGYLLLIQSNNPGIHLSYDNNSNPLTQDCSTSFPDFKTFSSHWMENGCDNPVNNWCGHADLDSDTYVTVKDLIIFAGLWLLESI